MGKINKHWLSGLLVFIILAIIYNLIYYVKEDVWNKDYIIISSIMAIVYGLGGFVINRRKE